MLDILPKTRGDATIEVASRFAIISGAPSATSPTFMIPFALAFFPFAAKPLPRCSRSCYHWPMSPRTSNSPLAAPHDPAPFTRIPFPKWNRRPQSSDFQEGGASAPPKERSRASSDSRRLMTAPAVARSLDVPSRSPCLSNRQSYEKLEPLASHRKHSSGLISNRHKTALHPRCVACVPLAPAKEGTAARDLLLSSASRLQHQYSNRKTYEKLELGVTPIKPTTSIFLIVKKTHFIQGAFYASRAQRGIWAQFQCSSPAGTCHLPLYFFHTLQPRRRRGRLIGRSALNGGAA